MHFTCILYYHKKKITDTYPEEKFKKCDSMHRMAKTTYLLKKKKAF